MQKNKILSSDFRLLVPIQVRFRDTDAMGHVNNAVYLSYLELARIQYWRAISGGWDYSKVSFILARVEIDYKIPVKLTDQVSVGIRMSRIGGASFDYDYAVFIGEPLRSATLAKTTQVMYDYASAKPMRMPQEYREKITKFEANDAKQ
ncbi:MAG: thioesterase family protein [Elusimicrobiota bacterium]